MSVMLLVASTVAVQAQRSGATFQGHAADMGVLSGFHSERSLSSGFFSRRSLANGGFFRQRGFESGFVPNRFRRHHQRFDGVLFPYFVPDYDPFWYESSDAEEAIEPPAPVVIEKREHGDSLMRDKPVPKSQIINIPSVAGSRAARTPPPTIFILMSGERLESRQFLLTVTELSLSSNHYRRTIPLQMLNLDATIAANRERGIDLRIPADRTEISLSF